VRQVHHFIEGKILLFFFKLSLPPQARSVAFFGWLLYIYDFCIMSRLLNFTLASLLMQSVRLEAAVSLLGSSFHFVRCTRSHISTLIPPLPHRSYLVFLVNDEATLVTNLVLDPDKIEIYYWFDGFQEFYIYIYIYIKHRTWSELYRVKSYSFNLTSSCL
jgi:hypothetical protein